MTIILSKKKILLDSKRDIKDFSKYFSTDKTFNQLHSQIPSGGTMAGIFSSGLEAAIMAKILKLLSKQSISLFASVFIKR
jgi:hypothetical protein